MMRDPDQTPTDPGAEPDSEKERLAALHALRVLDTPAEPRFDRLTRLAATLFKVPTALVSLIDAERQWFKSRHGFEACETGRRDAFCNRALSLPGRSVMVVEDATRDPLFADNPHVIGEDHVRFYAGALLTTASGHNLGSLCVLDTRPRRFSGPDRALLRELADLVTEQLELTTERLAAEEKRWLLELAESVSHVGHWRRTAGGETTWSDEVYRIFGLPPQPPGMPVDTDAVRSAYAPGQRARLETFLARAMDEDATGEFQTSINRPDGKVRQLVVSARRQLDETGRVEGLFGVVQDVTERHRALERVRRSEAQFRLLADHMGDVVTRLKLDGSSRYISPAIRGLLGYTAEEMEGRPAQAFLHPDDQAGLLDTFARIAAGERRSILQHRALHRDGHVVWVETTFQAVLDSGDRPTEVIAVIRDVSERHLLEEELREARDRAEAASEAKSRFLANISHEVRTPLTSIIGFSKLLQAREGLGAVEKQCADRIHMAGQALLSIINDVLDYSKLEAGAMVLAVQPFEIRALVRETSEIVLGQLEEKGLWYVEEVDEEVPAVLMGDAGRLRQVLLNLMSNAIKFTGQGGVSVHVRTIAGPDGAGRVRVTVADTGIGVPPEVSAMLFERFVQADESTTRRFGGTGLGLAISRQLVEMMGGEIGVRSTPGQGSDFWFEFPLNPAPATGAAP
ncbi:MAG: ATP-binding protein [Brevundimonas sp.]|uniref:sensor histidine kinase n=1 Tax=Brevundimonas sp. TaxID=1871086 RepID=UPI002AB7FF97|nr:ATP-binding protein [Brevundimonas sp.]MDZ4113707.1 ATP-binding protein [Brevundimonas sp.]